MLATILVQQCSAVMKPNTRLDHTHTRALAGVEESRPVGHETAGQLHSNVGMSPAIVTTPQSTDRRRSPLRERLIEVERGMSQGFRLDSTFFVHFFVISILVASGIVFELGVVRWCLLVTSLSTVLAAEMFNQVLKIAWDCAGHLFDERTRKASKIGSAGVFVTIVGAVIVIGLVFGHRLVQLYG